MECPSSHPSNFLRIKRMLLNQLNLSNLWRPVFYLKASAQLESIILHVCACIASINIHTLPLTGRHIYKTNVEAVSSFVDDTTSNPGILKIWRSITLSNNHSSTHWHYEATCWPVQLSACLRYSERASININALVKPYEEALFFHCNHGKWTQRLCPNSYNAS